VLGIGCRPANIDPHVAAHHPIQLPQSLQERSNARLPYRVIRRRTDQYADPSHALVLLRARRERPSRRAGEQRDERAARHSITSSARANSLSGTSRPSALAVLNPNQGADKVDSAEGMATLETMSSRYDFRTGQQNKLILEPPIAAPDEHERLVEADQRFQAALAQAIAAGGERIEAVEATVQLKRRRTKLPR